MYFTTDSMLPENQPPLIITVAPFGPAYLPPDFPEDIPVSWEEQTQKAIDCYNAGATVLHLHVREPDTGHGSKNVHEYNAVMERLRDAVPDMVIQVGGSISFAPASDTDQAAWLGYDTRHMLAEITPKPDQVTIGIGSTLMNIMDLSTPQDVQGTSLADPLMQAAYMNMVGDSTPEFYLEHLKRLRAKDIQPYFMLAHIHHLEIIEHLIRTGAYMGPLNHNLTAIGGGFVGRNPFDFMEYVRRSPQGSTAQIESLHRTVAPYGAMAIALGINVRVGIEDNLWSTPGVKMTSVQQVEQMVRIAHELHREVATGPQIKEMYKLGTWYNSPNETLANLGLPPNREHGQLGFMVKETDGRIKPANTAADAGHALIGV